MQMSLRITASANRRHFQELVSTLKKDLDGKYDPSTKTWTIDTDNAQVRVWRRYAEHQGQDDVTIVRTHLQVGKWYTEVTA